jgi:hypothetical protein
MRPDPKIRIILSDEYCEIMVDMGTTDRNELATTGTMAVTVIFIGRVIHQKIIQNEIPTACAPEVVSEFESSRTVRAKMAGPVKI